MNDVSMTAVPQVSPVRFAGRPGFIKLILKNGLLTVLTFGIYRFWARTATRRYLWNNVIIGGEPLEYTGRGIELFIGFLIASAILFPVFLLYTALQFLLLTSDWGLYALGFIYGLAIMVLTQVAIYRARRYKLTRTQWRGIRCGQDGSTWRYVGLVLGWAVASLMTLGLAEPWAAVARWRYEMTHTVFGNRRFGFDGQGADLLKRWLIVFAVMYVPIIIAVVIDFRDVWEWFDGMEERLENEEPIGRMPISPLSIVLLVFAFTAGMLAFYWYAIWQFRYLVAHTYLGEISFRSGIRARNFIGYALGFFASTALWFALLGAIAVGLVYFVAPMSGTNFSAAFGSVTAIFILVGAYLLGIAGAYLLLSVWFIYRPARHIASTMTIANLAAIESVAQSPGARPRFGEGLADAFDVGAV